MKKIAIGISDFRKIRLDNFYLVDKTLFIKEILDEGAEVLLIPRPRRFGKTLNMTMLKYFFEKTKIENENRELFNGLAIENEPEFNQHFGKYPVIFLSLKDVKSNSYTTAYEKICRTIAEIFKENSYILPNLDENDKIIFNKITSLQANVSDIETSIFYLSKFLNQYYHSQIILLIDEYDTPIHSSYTDGYYDEMIALIRNILGAALKDNKYLKKGVITGIMRIAKESIFSGLNNLTVYSILNTRFADKFGFTNENVQKFLTDFNIENQFEKVKEWYNGYVFGNIEIYNPWSIINYIHFNDAGFAPYWANTASTEIIKELVLQGGDSVREDIFLLLQKEILIKPLRENIVFKELRGSETQIFSFLLFSGYLKTVGKQLINNIFEYQLQIPNIELEIIFKEIIMNWFDNSYETSKTKKLLQSLINGNIESFERILSEFIVTTLSYFDTSGKNVEKVYQAFILGLLVNLGNHYYIESEKESGYGRFDVAVLPKDTTKKVIVMELKKIDDFDEETKDKCLEAALTQLRDRQYDIGIKARGYSDILQIAITFDGKRAWVKKLENL